MSAAEYQADRRYSAPRNPLLESPGLDAILQGDQVAPPERFLVVYAEASFTPQPRTSLGGGTLHSFPQGLLFLPRGSAGRDADIAALKGFALALAGGFVLSLGNVLVDAAKDAVVEKALLPEKSAEEQLRARFSSPNLFAIPWGDVVEAADAVTRENRHLIRSYVRRTTVRAIDAAGEERAYTFTTRVGKKDRLEIAESLPYRLFEQRTVMEDGTTGWRVMTTAVGYHERAKEKLSALGIEIESPYVTTGSLADALGAGFAAGRIGDVTVGEVAAALDASWVPAAFETWRLDHDDADVARRWLELLAPVLAAYRREPHLACLVEPLEHMAAGNTPESYTSSFDLTAQAANLP
jgi:hypothetical protein